MYVLVMVLAVLFHSGGAFGFELRSTAFEHEQPIPKKHTCDGDDVSPALLWSGVPEGTVTLALIVDDPDAPDPKRPKFTWVHWVAYDIPAGTDELPENAGAGSLPAGVRYGKNDWNRSSYGGPCPPIGRHRYVHKLYALDVALGDLGEPNKATLKKAMKGHILGMAKLIGTYERSR